MDLTEHPISQRIKLIIENESDGKVVEFASKLDGISYQLLSRLFKRDTRSGKFPTPSTEIILAIINKFTQYDPRWLMTGEGDPYLDGDFFQEESQNSRDLTTEELVEYWKGEFISVSKKYQALQEDFSNLLKNKLKEALEDSKRASAS